MVLSKDDLTKLIIWGVSGKQGIRFGYRENQN
jgi:hypothetical protein